MTFEPTDNLDKNEPSIKNALTWWENKRVWYNISVAISGLLPIFLYASNFSLADAIGLILYGVVLNVFYSVGFLIEAFNIHYLKRPFHLHTLRYTFLIIGTLVSAGVTFLWATIYFSW